MCKKTKCFPKKLIAELYRESGIPVFENELEFDTMKNEIDENKIATKTQPLKIKTMQQKELSAKTASMKRLLSLSLHLQKIQITEELHRNERPYESSKAGIDVEHYYWAIREIPRVFQREWFYDQNLEPRLMSHRNYNGFLSAGKFFRLTGSELFFLFAPHYEYPPYNLPATGIAATPGEIASKIYQFILGKKRELEKINGNKKIQIL